MRLLQELLAVAFDAANDAIALTGMDGEILHVNPAFTEIYGYTMADLSSLRMADIRSPVRRDALATDLRTAAKAGSLSYETEHRRRDGSVFPVDISIRKVTIDGCDYWVSILRDITVRKTAERRAARLRRLYDALLDANRAVVQAADRHTLFSRICQTCVDFGFTLAWVGLRRADAVVPVATAGACSGYLDGLAITVRDNHPTGQGPTGTAIRTGRPVVCNDFLVCSTGLPWQERAKAHGLAAAAAFPLLEGGQAVGALTLYASRSGFFDTDEVALIEQFAATVSLGLDRLAAEDASRRLTNHPLVRTIFDTVPAAILVAHDREGRHITGNRAAERLLRAAPGGNLSQNCPQNPASPLRMFRAGVEVPQTELPIRHAILGDAEVVDDELELRFADGSAVFIRGNAMPLHDSAGEVTGAVGVFVDVTRRREAEKALAEARDIAEKAVAAKGRFLAAASHDLRQPLQGLVLMLDVLTNRLAAEHADILNKVRSCTATLCELTEDFLDVAKLESGIIAVSMAEVAIDDLLAEILPAVEAAAVAKGLRLHHVRSRLSVRTDPALMRRILVNLLSNAVKYTLRGGIVVGTRRRGREARLEIWDSGIGIPADKLAAVFEEFLQLDNPERARNKGSGLGLAIVDRSARLLGVKVTVRSEPGKGSCFAVEVPLA